MPLLDQVPPAPGPTRYRQASCTSGYRGRGSARRAARSDRARRIRPGGRRPDAEIYDAVLIAAAFCIYNRYVDGIATSTPDDRDGYRQAAEAIIARSYRNALIERRSGQLVDAVNFAYGVSSRQGRF